VEPLLLRTGRVVQAIACPHPSGDGCPRRVVRHGEGRLVAVCGERPHRCDSIVLDEGDIDVLELNLPSFARLLRRVLGLEDDFAPPVTPGLWPVGKLGISAGLGIPALLGFSDPDRPIMAHELPESSFGMFLTPTGRFSEMPSAGWTVLSLAEAIGIGPEGTLVATETWARAVDEYRVRARAAAARSEVTWTLPPETRWEDFVFDLVADEVFNVRVGTMTRRCEPEQLLMKDRRNGRPTEQWEVMKLLARGCGTIGGARAPVRIPIKQKQETCRKLKAVFGLSDDPIRWRRANGVYQARFVIRDSRPYAVIKREQERE
jgi:hypothetical protein